MELVEVRDDGSSTVDLRFSIQGPDIQFGLCPAKSRVCQPIASGKEAYFLLHPGVFVSPTPAQSHAARLLAGSWSLGSGCCRLAGGRGAGVCSAQRVKRQGRCARGGGRGRPGSGAESAAAAASSGLSAARPPARAESRAPPLLRARIRIR